MRGRLVAGAVLASTAVAVVALVGTGAAASPECQGHARLRHHGYVNFAFTCGSHEPTGFVIHANHRIRSVDDPDGVYGCRKLSSRAWDCEDQHSGAPDRAHARLRVAGEVCDPKLVLRVAPRLDFQTEGQKFTLRGPC
jgi:hypothetical protein